MAETNIEGLVLANYLGILTAGRTTIEHEDGQMIWVDSEQGAEPATLHALLAIADDQYPEEINHPDWKRMKDNRGHEWGNMVPDEIQELWPRLCWETKVVCYFLANIDADSAAAWD